MNGHIPAESADLLARLMGPAGPELTCDEWFEQLDRYVELQRSGRDADAAVPGMRAHLAGCPACREECESLSALLRSEVARVAGVLGGCAPVRLWRA
jgi:hypothetical protein